MKAIRLFALFLFGLLVSSASARADGWLSNLNPFASKQTAPVKPRPVTGSNVVVTQMNGKPVQPSSSSPSFLSKIGTGTSNLFSKTKQMFTPAAKTPASTTRSLGTPAGNPQYSRSGAANVTTPSTASQFIGQQRP